MSREKTLENISNDRRGFFRTLLIGAGTAAVAVPLMTTQSLAQKEGERRDSALVTVRDNDLPKLLGDQNAVLLDVGIAEHRAGKQA